MIFMLKVLITRLKKTMKKRMIMMMEVSPPITVRKPYYCLYLCKLLCANKSHSRINSLTMLMNVNIRFRILQNNNQNRKAFLLLSLFLLKVV